MRVRVKIHLLGRLKKIISHSSVFFIIYYCSWARMTHDIHLSTAWSCMQLVLATCAPRLGCPRSTLREAHMRSLRTWSYHSGQNLQTGSSSADSPRLLTSYYFPLAAPSLHPYTFISGLRLRFFFTLSSQAALCLYRFQLLYSREAFHGIL